MQALPEAVSQTQPISPPIETQVHESDEDGEGSDFGIVAHPIARPSKKLKLEASISHF